MLAALLAPFVISGVIAAILATAGTVLIILFFMLVDATFARWIVFLTGAGILLYRWLT